MKINIKWKLKTPQVSVGVSTRYPYITCIEQECQVQIPESTRQQYSKTIKQNNSTVKYCYDSDKIIESFKNMPDIIPNDGYYPFYSAQVRTLGMNRFMELAQKARAGSDTPARLFAWMLKNNEMVK